MKRGGSMRITKTNNKNREVNQHKILSLFCNVGIAETLLDPAKFKTVVSSELIEKRAKFYNHFYPEVVQVVGDISEDNIKKQIIEASLKAGVDFVMAAPPCQGFSIAGQRRKDDPRNLLTFDAMEIIKALKPKYIFIENVPQFFTDKVIYENREVLIPGVIAEDFGDDYIFQKAILDTQDFGVPQHRRRGIILMSRKDVPV
jgi:DNA (cytosine-5)-methyltransferase 1